MRRVLVFGLVSGALCLVAAPPEHIRMPLVGFAMGSSPVELRPIVGRAGANLLGSAIPVAADVRAILPAPGQQYALVRRGDPEQMGVAALTSDGLGEFRPLVDAVSQADFVSFSPVGMAAVLYSRADHRLQVISGLPGAPRMVRDMDTMAFPAALRTAAVSDDGVLVLAAFSSGVTGYVALLGADGAPRTVVNGASLSAVRFFPRRHDAVVADREANRVMLVSEDASSPGVLSARVLAGEAQGVSGPLDLETSTDGTRVYLANTGAKNVLMVEVASGVTQTLAAGSELSSFQRLMKSVVSLRAPDGKNVWVLDTDAAAPWVSYAPRVVE